MFNKRPDRVFFTSEKNIRALHRDRLTRAFLIALFGYALAGATMLGLLMGVIYTVIFGVEYFQYRAEVTNAAVQQDDYGIMPVVSDPHAARAATAAISTARQSLDLEQLDPRDLDEKPDAPEAKTPFTLPGGYL